MVLLQALGLDVGSTTVKMVGVDSGGELAWHVLEQAEPRVADQVSRLLVQARRQPAAGEDIPLVATGYGRKLVDQAIRQVTEISCHARGVAAELPEGGTLVDIGGQDSKVIRIGQQGKVIDFAMNDKCAAGTGRFLEHTAYRLRVPVERLGPEALSTSQEVVISSTCTVFAESEVISLIANGVPLAAILRGLHRSLVQRIVALVRSVGLQAPLVLSGGVAHNTAICQMLGEQLVEEVRLPHYPQLSGAYGAALYALDLKV